MAVSEKKTHSIRHKEEDVRFYEIGEEGNEAVVLIHSAFTDHRLFDRQIPDLSRDYRLILVDMPGHGAFFQSRSRITMGDMPELIRLMLDHLGIGSCHLAGVSLGALAAQAFAFRYPERTKSVTAVGSYSIHKANSVALQEQARLRRRWIRRALFSIRKFRAEIVSAMCTTEEGRHCAEEGARHFRFASFKAMKGVPALFAPRLHPVNYPLLIVVGDQDQEYMQKTARAWHQLEPGSRLLVLTGAGHLANADAPAIFNLALRQFLAGISETKNGSGG